VKRKRHSKKPLSEAKLTLRTKRGRQVLTEEEKIRRTTKELEAEIARLKAAKREATLAKNRRRRQPKPIKERKALDHQPVLAGQRMDRKARIAARKAKAEERAAAKERRRQEKELKERQGAEEVDMQGALGKDFFATDDVEAPDAGLGSAGASAGASAGTVVEVATVKAS